MTEPPERPTRALIIATVFFIGAYPPVIWTMLMTLAISPFLALGPVAVLSWMTWSLTGLWRARSLGWLSVTLTFLFGWMISVATLGNRAFDGPWDRDAWLNAAAAAYFTLALATMLAMNLGWGAWAEEVAGRKLRRAGGSSA